MKFKVTIRETLERTVTIDAEDESQAIDKVLEDYDNEKIILDADDFSETTFECGRVIRSR